MTTVLIVGDEPTQANRFASLLRESEEHEVVVSYNAAEGYEMVRKIWPELLILDIGKPGLDGLSMSRMLRRNKETAHIPIIMLSKRGTISDKVDGLDSGADDYLVKPVLVGEFLSRVRAILRRRNRRAVPDEITSGNLRLCIVSRQLYLDGNEVRIPNMEFNLLMYLMLHSKVAHSRVELLTAVWDNERYISTRTVDVHIRWLREKIEVNAAEPQRIVTVRGHGYRFQG